MLSLGLPFLTSFLLATSSSNSSTKPRITVVESLIASARQSLHRNDTDAAYTCLAEAYARNANAPGLMSCLEDLFRLKIRLHDDSVDRMGLASLLSDQGKYEEAAKELRSLLLAEDRQDESPVIPVDDDERGSTNTNKPQLLGSKLREKATSMLFRTQAAICYWDKFDENSSALVDSVRASIASNNVPAVHPYEALMWSCISLEDATMIASMYAMRAMKSVANSNNSIGTRGMASRQQLLQRDGDSVPFVKVSRQRDTIHPARREKIKLGYISPDFTGMHPLAFLMQDVFRFHNASQFDVHIYSLYESDGSPEVEKIKHAAKKWTVLPSTAKEIADKIIADDLDVIVDLCGYTGTSLIAEVMAHRVAPVQIAYMGFPASSGAPFMDYMICDKVVVPPMIPSFRKHYSERLIIMPHCYFVNSHRYISGDDSSLGRISRAEYGLPVKGFVFCCHSRPDKIDPSTFRAWLRVLKKVREDGARDGLSNKANATLWLLRSGDEMEENLRKRAKEDFGLGKESLVFAEKAPRHEHLRRLGLADLFLDTPSYNAHTVGCDCLSAGVPMISLLRRPQSKMNKESVATEKLASRVGASLLTNIGLDELIVPSMGEYEAVMTRCVSEPEWFSTITERLRSARDTSPLFDTERWVRNLEAGLTEVVQNKEDNNSDVYVVDDA